MFLAEELLMPALVSYFLKEMQVSSFIFDPLKCTALLFMLMMMMI